MRGCVAIGVGVSVLAACADVSAAPRFPTGWWQSTELDASDGQATHGDTRVSQESSSESDAIAFQATRVAPR
jgi:hypothetical protein